MPDTGPLHLPYVPAADNGPRWLPRKDPPPLGEWTFIESISMGMEASNQWVLRCYPIFEARVHWQSAERRYHLTMMHDFGRFRNIDVAQQRAEREIINRMREVMPVLAIIRRRLLNTPVAQEPPDPARRISMKPLKREPRRACICGVVGNDKTQLWGVPNRWREVTYYCYDCLPDDMKEILDKPPPGQGCTGFTEAKCECLHEAVYVVDGRAYCEECLPKGMAKPDG